MELDSLKKSWQEANIKPAMDENKIQHMINNQGRSAFSSLLTYEKIGIIIAIICLPLSLIFKDIALIILYLISVPIIITWQVYKYKYLKKIDLTSMNILEVSKRIIKYRKYLSIEFIVAIVWAIIFCLLFVFRTIVVDIANMKHIAVEQVETLTIVLLLLGILLTLVVTVAILFKFLYLNNIKRIQSAIKEIQEFEQENNNQ